ncbi:MAG: RagB/SusD family nutrient uptake outer membrane protein, partial [Muribaculaceae bacterium]|nr:RagB/SusD family nutrient uptake outer membrane protein [Muribaculaceae bacterium]
MNKIFKNIALLACGALLSLTSCNDFLDKVPDTRVDLTSVEQLRELLVDGYMFYNIAVVGELSSDNVIDNNSPSDKGVRYNLSAYDVADDEIFAWEDVKMGMGSDSPSGIWEACYHAIAAANAVLERAEVMETQGTLTPSDKEKLQAVKGEALLIRAFHHFVLTNVFCMPYRGDALSQNDPGVPYITKPETEVKPMYERGTVTETYKKIEDDLLAGLPLINDAIYEVPKYHFNRAAANADAARFYLYKRDDEKVEEYATAAFKGNDPATICSDGWKQNDFYYIRDIGRYFTSVNRTNVMMLISSYSTAWRRFLGYRYAPNREAKRATIQGPGPSWENCMYQNTRTKEVFAMNPCFMSVCGVAGGQEYGTYFAGTSFEQFEYTDKIQGIGYCHNVQAEFTTEQTLLDRAEAYLFLGNVDAAFNDLKVWDDARQDNTQKSTSSAVPLTKALIEKFYKKYEESGNYGIAKPIHLDEVYPHDKYHVTEAIEPYLQCVQHYRRIETVHTGKRWFDIKRYGLELTHKIGASRTETLKTLDPRYAIQI